MELRIDEIETPLGPMLLAESGGAVCALEFGDFRARMVSLLQAQHGAIELVRAPGASAVRLRAYFEGDWDALDGIAVQPAGTPFQLAVWSELRRVRAGTTSTYGAIAAAVGRPSAARAVGAAVGQNPIAIVVPCHRIVGAGGALTGYAGGLDRKRWLLQHEAAAARTEPLLPLFDPASRSA